MRILQRHCAPLVLPVLHPLDLVLNTRLHARGRWKNLVLLQVDAFSLLELPVEDGQPSPHRVVGVPVDGAPIVLRPLVLFCTGRQLIDAIKGPGLGTRSKDSALGYISATLRLLVGNRASATVSAS